MVQLAIMCGSGCYAFAAIGYLLEGKWWMAATFGLYMLANCTIYMGGDH